MDRQPIISESVAVKLVQNPLTVKDLLPKYQFQLQLGKISEESLQMFNEFIEFLNTNEELAFSEGIVSYDDYIKGFQRSIALFKLWIDSIYLENNIKE